MLVLREQQVLLDQLVILDQPAIPDQRVMLALLVQPVPPDLLEQMA